ncbi:Hypothetical predicted protein [Pelobates cultripes]|uniref:Uncharacterized protein n=1 Tax=Pelobates cultripes TaxID=61616 RepID=A0AAD1VUS0_PELCU|nr:Hypothetical predicted protein [Pelobates cultripes]
MLYFAYNKKEAKGRRQEAWSGPKPKVPGSGNGNKSQDQVSGTKTNIRNLEQKPGSGTQNQDQELESGNRMLGDSGKAPEQPSTDQVQ